MRIDKQKVCSNCPCFNLIDSCCNLTDAINELPCDTVLPDCPLPLVSAPKIHGRLIDADAYIDKHEECGWLDDITVDEFNAITPTIIEAEVGE